MKWLADLPAKHTRSDMPKPVLDAAMGDVLRDTLAASPPNEWHDYAKRQAQA